MTYKGLEIDAGYRIDLLVEQLVVVEIKSVERLMPIHEAQLIHISSSVNTGWGCC